MSKIVFIGSANMDSEYDLSSSGIKLTEQSVEKLTEGDIKRISGGKEPTRELGGKGANQAIATKLQSKEDDEIIFISCIGKDEAGLSIVEKLKKLGIDYSRVKVLDGYNTDGRQILLDANRQNFFKGYGKCIEQLKPEIIDTSVLEDADMIVIQMKMPAETVKFIIEYCEKNNKKIVIDPTPLKNSSILVKENCKLLKKATYLTPNEDEAFALAKYMEGKSFEEIQKEYDETPREIRLRIIEELVRKYPNIIATIGDKGVIYNNNGKTIRKATYPTECKDSTGAGDTFNGALVAAIARGEALERAIEYALTASSIKVKTKGAQNGMPTFDRTRKTLEELEKNKKNGEHGEGDGNR